MHHRDIGRAVNMISKYVLVDLGTGGAHLIRISFVEKFHKGLMSLLAISFFLSCSKGPITPAIL